MKAETTIFFTLMSILLSVSSQVNAQDETNYCYKPSKPLFFSTAKNNRRYNEDMQEYQRCQQSFAEMQERAARIKKESEMNSQLILDTYMDKNN